MTKYWIKLYHEILNDPKMGMLSDRTWRRCIELFLLAGDTNDEGKLPSVSDISWILRVNQDDLIQDMQELESVGILTSKNDGTSEGDWIVTNFVTRQDADTDAERKRRSRESERNNHVSVTSVSRNVTKDVTTDVQDIDIDKDISRAGKEPARAKPAQSSEDKAYYELQDLFLQYTGLPKPTPKSQAEFKEFQTLWKSPGKSILEWVDGDMLKAGMLVTESVDSMRKDQLTISNFKSIIKVASNGYSKRNGH